MTALLIAMVAISAINMILLLGLTASASKYLKTIELDREQQSFIQEMMGRTQTARSTRTIARQGNYDGISVRPKNSDGLDIFSNNQE